MRIGLDFKHQGQQRLILTILVGVILFVLYLNLLFKPTIAGLKEVNPKLYELKQEIKKVERWVNERAETEKQLKELQSRMGYYKTMLSTEEEIPSVLEELSNIAGGTDVKIIGIKPKGVVTFGAEGKKVPYHEIPISIRARGGYHQIGQFISKLESADRLFAVEDIEIKGNLQTPRIHHVNLIVSAFLVSED